ncbi:hypothetical protein TWF694_006192 [Orbilia ellipsospora]|uniref:Uncharacterized protein n=1 Tax=Orbilia ellipsospora TaxID=2528407 RepID=A0AAV9WSH7_9PEZI
MEWGNGKALAKSAGDFVKAIGGIPKTLECRLDDLREAAQDVIIALQKAPGQVASELQKFDRGWMVGSLAAFSPAKLDEVGYMALAICYVSNSYSIPKFTKAPLYKCPPRTAF